MKLAINALPIPVSDYTPESMVLAENPPLAGFTVADGIEPLQRINCFSSGMGRVETIILSRRVEVRLPRAITGKRGRINCTIPYIKDGRIQVAGGGWGVSFATLRYYSTASRAFS